jgi:hypothetical protein
MDEHITHLAVMANYLIDLPVLSWLDTSWWKAVWIMWSIVFATLFGGCFYLTYVGITEILKTLPVN